MREFFDRLQFRIADFMNGRYGMDELNKFLLILGLIILILTTFIPIPFVSLISWVFIIFAIMRALSRNINARQNENTKYQEIAKKPKSTFKYIDKKWTNRKTTIYFKCKGCGTKLSVPKGKGKIRVVCPKCKTEIFKTT